MEADKDQSVFRFATRREFIKKTAAAAAALAATPVLKTPVYGQNQAPSAGVVAGANDRIVVGFIGVGGQGMAHVRDFKANAAQNNVVPVAVCDVWKKRIDQAREFIGGDCQGYGDYRKLLERKDIDAVVISTHEPLHAAATIAALQAGKHVYVEKPLTRYLGEAFEVRDTVKKTGKILQVGTQGCSAAAWHKAAEMIRSGKIGTLVWAQGYYCRNAPKGEWNYPIDSDCSASNTNWEAWLGPVHKRIPFNADHYFRWRKYYPYCAGLLGDLFPHRLNPLMLATGNPEFPVRVVSIGTKNVHTDRNTPDTPERDVPEHMTVLAEFPSGLTLVIAASSVNAKSPGFVLYGHRATLEIGTSGERLQLLPEKEFADEIDPETMDGLTPSEDIPVHEKNWLDCIRANKQPSADIELAVRAQAVISLAEMADRLKTACLFDEKSRTIKDESGRKIEPLTYGTLPLS
jgi:predicted dehydrogenase